MTKKKLHNYRGVEFMTRDSYQFDPWTATYDPSLKQIKNMIDMVAAIQTSPPPRFNMENYCKVDDVFASPLPKYILNVLETDNVDFDPYLLNEMGKMDKEVVHECGTSACALGTAAYHGVGKISRKQSWDDYSDKTFGIRSFYNIWNFVFAPEWADSDNSSEGAAARALALVIEGGEVIDTKFPDLFKVGGTIIDDDVIEYYQKYKKILVVV